MDQEFSKDREFSVILEGLRSDFRVFGEGLSGLQDRVGAVEREVSGMSQFLQAYVDLHDNRLNNHEHRIVALEHPA